MYRSTSPIALATVPFERLDKSEVQIERLSNEHQSEVLEFLSRRPVELRAGGARHGHPRQRARKPT